MLDQAPPQLGGQVIQVPTADTLVLVGLSEERGLLAPAESLSGEGKSPSLKPPSWWSRWFSIRNIQAREAIAATPPIPVQIPSGAPVMAPIAIATAAPPTTLLITAIIVPVVKNCWRRWRLTPMFRITPSASS